MPVIVIGADTEIGSAVVSALAAEDAEVRAFVTSVDSAEALKSLGAKVAIGDVSDAGHIAGAAYETFCAVLIDEAATDGRERSFASDHDEVIAAWTDALVEAHPQRAIWVASRSPGDAALASTPEQAVVDPGNGDPADVVESILALESADRIT